MIYYKKMDSNDESKEIIIKNRTCYYFLMT